MLDEEQNAQPEDIPEEMFCETSEAEKNEQEQLTRSISIQTDKIEYIVSVRNKKTQTLVEVTPSEDLKTKATQTLITNDYLCKRLCTSKSVSCATQTTFTNSETETENAGENNISSEINKSVQAGEIHSSVNVNKDNLEENAYLLPSSPAELPSDDIGIDRSADDEFLIDEESDQEETELISSDKIQMTLTSDKLLKDQVKFIVCEESIANLFRFCFKCNALCTVIVESNIGTYCKICVICPSYFKHSFSWTTGPLSNRLPILNLMVASSIVCTGMEYSKVIRFMESLNILCIKQREFSNLQSAYVIPAVFNVWKKEQLVLLDYIKDKSICIASDMRVDSPGHTGLFGSGSTLDVDRNVILDTQVIKVNFSMFLFEWIRFKILTTFQF